MLVVLLAHAIAAAVAPVLVMRWGRLAFYPLALVPAASLVWVALNWPPDGHAAETVRIPWVPELSMDIDLRFDTLAAIMSVLVLGIGALVLFYCAGYFDHRDGHTENRLPSFAAELVAFSGAMFGLVISDNMLLLYTFWELTTVLSFLLVGHYAERATSRRAARQPRPKSLSPYSFSVFSGSSATSKALSRGERIIRTACSWISRRPWICGSPTSARMVSKAAWTDASDTRSSSTVRMFSGSSQVIPWITT